VSGGTRCTISLPAVHLRRVLVVMEGQLRLLQQSPQTEVNLCESAPHPGGRGYRVRSVSGR